MTDEQAPKPHRRRGAPGWPDFRGWVAMGFFALTFYMLWMIDQHPAFLDNASFMQVLSTLLAGGVLLIAMNLFGGNKASAEANAKLTDAYTGARNAAPPSEPTP